MCEWGFLLGIIGTECGLGMGFSFYGARLQWIPHSIF